MESLKAFFANDRFAAENGIELVELGAGFARARMPINGRHHNSVGIVHGGALFTLADFAFAAASNSAGRLAVAIQTNLSCLVAVASGVLEAEAREVSRSRRISTCSVRISDEHGRLVALFQGTAYVKDSTFPPEPGSI